MLLHRPAIAIIGPHGPLDRQCKLSTLSLIMNFFHLCQSNQAWHNKQVDVTCQLEPLENLEPCFVNVGDSNKLNIQYYNVSVALV
jgi:hypothetical protein